MALGHFIRHGTIYDITGDDTFADVVRKLGDRRYDIDTASGHWQIHAPNFFWKIFVERDCCVARIEFDLFEFGKRMRLRNDGQLHACLGRLGLEVAVRRELSETDFDLFFSNGLDLHCSRMDGRLATIDLGRSFGH